MEKTPLTKKGAERLRADLQRMKDKERPRIIEAIAEARAHGDLKENAEYHAAKEQQGLLESKIKDLEAYLSHSEVIDVANIKAGNRIVFGATVTLYDEDQDSEQTWQIVGEKEADVKHNLLSIKSPVARALIGKSLDDEINLKVPSGEHKRYTITAVEYG